MLILFTKVDTICSSHSSKAGVVGRIAAWLALTPAIVHTVHGLPFHRYQPEVKKQVFIWIEKFSNLFCHKIVAVTQTIIDTMLGYNIGNPNKYLMIRSAFDTDIYKVDGDDHKSKTRERFGIEVTIISLLVRLLVYHHLKGTSIF